MLLKIQQILIPRYNIDCFCKSEQVKVLGSRIGDCYFHFAYRTAFTSGIISSSLRRSSLGRVAIKRSSICSLVLVRHPNFRISLLNLVMYQRQQQIKKFFTDKAVHAPKHSDTLVYFICKQPKRLQCRVQVPLRPCQYTECP